MKLFSFWIQGGGWCLNSTLYQTFDYSVQHCASRVYAYLGSSLHMPAAENLTGILSSDPKNNAFYNWNRVFIRYCDGGSFAGDVEQPDPVCILFLFRQIILWVSKTGLDF